MELGWDVRHTAHPNIPPRSALTIADPESTRRKRRLLKWLDIGLLLLLAAYLVVLALILLIRVSRGESTGYNQLSVRPESWRRWALSEKTKT